MPTGVSHQQRLAQRITEFMQVEKDCGTASSSGCFSTSNVKRGTGSNAPIGNYTSYYKVLLSDGTSVAFGSSGIIAIDIDGPNKGENRCGKDIFYMETDSLRISPTLTSAPSPFTIYGTDAETFGASEDEITGANCSAGTNPFSCTAWILQYDNADYLHCDVTAANPTCN